MNDLRHITLFGATGNIGSGVIKLLSDAQIPVVGVTRDLKKAMQLPFVEWKQADMAQPKQLLNVLSGSGAVFLLSGPGPDCKVEQINVIRAASTSGVNHIVKLSSGEANSSSPYFIPRTHGQVEEYLKESGVSHSILRSNGMMQNWLGEIADNVKKERRFYQSTGDGKRAYVDRRDIIEVAFNCLTAPEKHINETYFLTGDKAINYYEVATCISNVIKEQVTYMPISIEEARLDMQRKGLPFALIETFCAYDAAQARGEKALATNCISTLLNRPARTIEQFFAEHKDYFM